MSDKALAHKLERIGDGQFGTAWSYKCDHMLIEDSFKEGFYNNISGNLLPGDTINVVEFKQSSVSAVCEFIVVSKLDSTVVCRPLTDHIKRFTEKEPKAANEEANHGDEYIKGDGEVHWNLGRKRHVVTVDGKEVASLKDKDEALAIARGDNPIPV